jgi:hypothetical protein
MPTRLIVTKNWCNVTDRHLLADSATSRLFRSIHGTAWSRSLVKKLVVSHLATKFLKPIYGKFHHTLRMYIRVHKRWRIC